MTVEVKQEFVFEVHQAEYMGEGYWADFLPQEFPSMEEAIAYVEMNNKLLQTKSGIGAVKTRGIQPRRL